MNGSAPWHGLLIVQPFPAGGPCTGGVLLFNGTKTTARISGSPFSPPRLSFLFPSRDTSPDFGSCVGQIKQTPARLHVFDRPIFVPYKRLRTGRFPGTAHPHSLCTLLSGLKLLGVRCFRSPHRDFRDPHIIHLLEDGFPLPILLRLCRRFGQSLLPRLGRTALVCSPAEIFSFLIPPATFISGKAVAPPDQPTSVRLV